MTARPFFLAVVMRNECPYILEFVAHYKLLGFDRIFIATNDNTDRTVELLERLQRLDFVTAFVHTVPPDGIPQRNGYRLIKAATKKAAKEFYIFPVDADEFLCLPDDGNIRAFMIRYPEATSVSFNWHFFGSNGKITRPPGLVMENYNYRCAEDHRAYSVLKTLSLDDGTGNLRGYGAHLPHFHDVSKVNAIYSDGEKIDSTNFDREDKSKGRSAWVTRGHTGAQLRHYGLKSWEEFLARRSRGGGMGQLREGVPRNRHSDEYFALYDKNEIFDPMPDVWIQQVKSEMWRMFEDAKLGDAFEPQYLGL